MGSMEVEQETTQIFRYRCMEYNVQHWADTRSIERISCYCMCLCVISAVYFEFIFVTFIEDVTFYPACICLSMLCNTKLCSPGTATVDLSIATLLRSCAAVVQATTTCFVNVLQYGRSRLLSVEDFRNVVDTLTEWQVCFYISIAVDYCSRLHYIMT